MYRLGEYLQEIPFLVAVDQNVEALEFFKVFVDLADPLQHRFVVGVRNVEKFDAAAPQLVHRVDDVFGTTAMLVRRRCGSNPGILRSAIFQAPGAR